MPTTYPHSAADLALAPVLINIEQNLARLRASADLDFELALVLNDDDSWYRLPADRAHRVQRYATSGVDPHGWTISPTPDLRGLSVSHGPYTVSLMFGEELTDYITSDVKVVHAGS